MSEAIEAAAAPEAVEAGQPAAPVETEAAAAPPPPQEPPKPVETDRSWAAIQRHEKKLREERDAFKQDRSAFDKDQADVANLREQLNVLQGGLRDDPLKFLKDNGVPFDELAKRVLNEGSATPEELIRRNQESSQTEMEKLREQVSSLQKQNAERDNQRMIQEYQGEITQALKSDDFELLRAYPDANERVFELVSRFASQHGEVLTPVAAANRIQGEMRENLMSLASNQAVKALLGLQDAGAEETPPEPEEQSPQPIGGINTLTNSLAATPAAEQTNFDGSSALSRYELLRRAALLVKD